MGNQTCSKADRTGPAGRKDGEQTGKAGGDVTHSQEATWGGGASWQRRAVSWAVKDGSSQEERQVRQWDEESRPGSPAQGRRAWVPGRA